MMCYKCCMQICESNCRACCWVSTGGIIKNECQPWAVNYHWVTRWKIKGRCNHISQIIHQCASSQGTLSASASNSKWPYFFWFPAASFSLHLGNVSAGPQTLWCVRGRTVCYSEFWERLGRIREFISFSWIVRVCWYSLCVWIEVKGLDNKIGCRGIGKSVKRSLRQQQGGEVV